MKKTFIVLFLCGLLLSILLVACESSSDNSNDGANAKRLNYGGRDFLYTEYNVDNYPSALIVDVKTKVQYIQIGLRKHSRIFTLVDAEGKPILYEGDID